MIVVRITGGLGNQMFQYAFARALQLRTKKVAVQWHGSRTISRRWELDTVFERPLSEKIRTTNSHPLWNLWAWVLRKTARTREPADMSFNPAFLEKKSGYLDGYWQTEKYFSGISETIRNDFRFQPLTGSANLELQKRIDSTSCVSVHVRRGDYVGHAGLGGICTPDYYNRALEEINRRHPGCAPVVFSDDIPYCRELFAKYSNAIYCDWNRGENSWMDMALMAQCKHHIIANSSFSWWGAWLGSADGTVIAPSKWFADGSRTTNQDIYPECWITV